MTKCKCKTDVFCLVFFLFQKTHQIWTMPQVTCIVFYSQEACIGYISKYIVLGVDKPRCNVVGKCCVTDCIKRIIIVWEQHHFDRKRKMIMCNDGNYTEQAVLIIAVCWYSFFVSWLNWVNPGMVWHRINSFQACLLGMLFNGNALWLDREQL